MGSLKIQIAKTIKTQAPIKIGLAAWGRWGRVSGNLGDFLEREIARKLGDLTFEGRQAGRQAAGWQAGGYHSNT